MDVHPLTAKIEENARNTAEGLLSEAYARITDLQATSDDTIDDLQRDAQKRAKADGDQLEQNLRRLGALEARKQLLSLKRGLIDESFDLALKQLHSLPTDKLRALFMEQLVRFAQGDETVYAGSVSGAFYDADFLKDANRLLKEAGKPGSLKDGGATRPNVCGLVLETAGTQSHLTAEAMVAQHRQSLEGDVAQVVCGDLT